MTFEKPLLKTTTRPSPEIESHPTGTRSPSEETEICRDDPSALARTNPRLNSFDAYAIVAPSADTAGRTESSTSPAATRYASAIRS